VPVGDRPILDIILRQLAYHGFRDVALTVGHLAELIEAYVAAARVRFVDVSFVRETAPLGTAGPIGTVPGLDETFLVLNGDVLTTLDYRGLLAYHRERGAMLTVGVRERRQRLGFGVVALDESGRLRSYDEKPELAHTVSMGVYVCEPGVLRYIEPNVYLDIPDLIQRLLSEGHRVLGYRSDDYWLDIGDPGDHAQACAEFEEMQDRLLPGEAVRHPGSAREP
jgi:NDP-sugar pyrophosphorylase family protein